MVTGIGALPNSPEPAPTWGYRSFAHVRRRLKARVERANRTLQNRPIKEMRLRNISTMEQANRYLPEYIADHNKRFARDAADPQDAHLPGDNVNLDALITYTVQRKVFKDISVSFNKIRYLLEDNETNRKGYRIQRAWRFAMLRLRSRKSIAVAPERRSRSTRSSFFGIDWRSMMRLSERTQKATPPLPRPIPDRENPKTKGIRYIQHLLGMCAIVDGKAHQQPWTGMDRERGMNLDGHQG